MLRRDAKVELIKRVPLFAKCSKAELRRIASIADEIDLAAGRVVIREGRRGSEFFVLIEGAVEVTAGEKRIRTLRGGDFFGEIALVSDLPRSATVTAATPLRVLVITRQGFRRLLEDSPGIQLKILQTLAERLSQFAGVDRP
jgi:CRP-like cAMP-binding protein